MALIPSTETDADNLRKLGVKGYVYPVDEAFGLTSLPFKMTLATMLLIADLSTKGESYEDAQKELFKQKSIIVNDDTMREVTNEIGTKIYSFEKEEAEKTWTKFQKGKLTFPAKKIPHTLYLEVDGAMVPIRGDENTDPQSKENKLGMAFSSDNILWWSGENGKKYHQIGKREYTSLIGDNAEFTKFMLNLAVKNDYGKYKNTVLISDGATWIRNMKDLIFPDAQQILDFYHLKEHITDFGKVIFNYEEDKYLPWSNQVSDLFKFSKSQEAIKLLKDSTKPRFKKYLAKLLNYIDNNSNNIDYAGYRSKGFFIASGAIESSNKTVVQKRLKISGAMRWHLNSAQAIVTLIAKKKSGLWESDVEKPLYSLYEQDFYG